MFDFESSRCDQYKWVHKGTHTVIFEDYAIKKKTASIDVKDKEKATGKNSFKRPEYWGMESFFGALPWRSHCINNYTI